MSWYIRAFPCLAFLAALILVAPGCPAKKTDPKKTDDSAGKKNDSAKKDDSAKKKDHDHPDEGPNGGVLAEWGEEKYHAEFTVDHKSKQATVYLLDGSAKKASPIAADSITLSITNVKPPVQITLKADPAKDDPKGSSSRFVGTHEKLGVEMEFKGEISGNGRGQK